MMPSPYKLMWLDKCADAPLVFEELQAVLRPACAGAPCTSLLELLAVAPALRREYLALIAAAARAQAPPDGVGFAHARLPARMCSRDVPLHRRPAMPPLMLGDSGLTRHDANSPSLRAASFCVSRGGAWECGAGFGAGEQRLSGQGRMSRRHSFAELKTDGDGSALGPLLDVVADHVERAEQAMIAQMPLSFEAWSDLFLTFAVPGKSRPVAVAAAAAAAIELPCCGVRSPLAALADALLFFESRSRTLFFVTVEAAPGAIAMRLQCLDVSERVVDVRALSGGAASLLVAHPAMLSIAEIAAWTALFRRRGLAARQPFPQLLRPHFVWWSWERDEHEEKPHATREGPCRWVLDSRRRAPEPGAGRALDVVRESSGQRWSEWDSLRLHRLLAPSVEQYARAEVLFRKPVFQLERIMPRLTLRVNPERSVWRLFREPSAESTDAAARAEMERLVRVLRSERFLWCLPASAAPDEAALGEFGRLSRMLLSRRNNA
jgi:hypothetical protein